MKTDLVILAKVARELGRNLNDRYGPKYEYVSEHGVTVYVDDYGHYMTAKSKDGRLLASSHPCDVRRVPGNWADHILRLEIDANERIAYREALRDEALKKEQKEKFEPYNIVA